MSYLHERVFKASDNGNNGAADDDDGDGNAAGVTTGGRYAMDVLTVAGKSSAS